MKNMVQIGIVLLVLYINIKQVNILIHILHMKANDICFFMKDKWQFYYIKWDDETI